MKTNNIDPTGINTTYRNPKPGKARTEGSSINTTDSFGHAANQEQNLIDIGKMAKILTEKTHLQNMRQLWKKDMSRSSMANQYNAPQINIANDGTVYGISSDNKGFALDKATGDVKWQTDIGTTRFNPPAVSPSGMLYFPVQNPHFGTTIKAVDGKTGELKWDVQVPEEISSTPLIGPDGKIYIATQGNDDSRPSKALTGAVIKLDETDGKRLWRCEVGYQVNFTPAMGADGKIWAGTTDERFCSMDGNSGKFVKANNIPAKGPYKNSSQPVTGPDGTMFIHSSNTELFAINPDTGEKKWSFRCDTVQDFAGVTVDGENRVFIGGKDGVLHALDGSNGKELWQKHFEGKNHALTTPMPDGKLCVCGRESNILRILDAKTGLDMGSAELDGKLYYPPFVSSDGTIHTSTDKGVIQALKYDERTLLEQVKDEKSADTEAENPDAKIEIKDEKVVIGGVELPRKRSEK